MMMGRARDTHITHMATHSRDISTADSLLLFRGSIALASRLEGLTLVEFSLLDPSKPFSFMDVQVQSNKVGVAG